MSIVADAELWQTPYSGRDHHSSDLATPDHAIQLTGYNAPGNYWIVRNSWGTDWGENGYVYVAASAATAVRHHDAGGDATPATVSEAA